MARLMDKRRGRNIALALTLGGFALLFYLLTFVRMGGQPS
jgi:hypothetical protein